MLRMFFSVLAVVFRCKVLKVDENAGLQDVEIPYTQQKTAELKKQN